MGLDRFGQTMGIKKITLNGETIEIKTELGDVRKYLCDVTEMKEKNETSKLIMYQFNFLEKLLKQGNPTAKKDLISEIVDDNFTELLNETLIALKLAKRDDVEKTEKVKN